MSVPGRLSFDFGNLHFRGKKPDGSEFNLSDFAVWWTEVTCSGTDPQCGVVRDVTFLCTHESGSSYVEVEGQPFLDHGTFPTMAQEMRNLVGVPGDPVVATVGPGTNVGESCVTVRFVAAGLASSHAATNSTISVTRVGPGTFADMGGCLCGDGEVDSGEACDDFGMLDGTCCSATCSIQPGPACSPPPELGATQGARLGQAVALLENAIAVGAPSESVAGFPNAGAVHVFRDDGTSCTIPNPDPEAAEQFGSVLAPWGNGLFVGAPREGSAGPDRGAVYHYDAACQKLAFEKAGAANDEWFGFAIVAAGGRVFIGAEQEDVGGIVDAGAVHVYDIASGTLLQTIQNPAPQTGAITGEFFGHALAVSASKLLVGAPFDNRAGPDAGAVYRYTIGATTPEKIYDNPTPHSRDIFGQAVAFLGDDVVVAAQYDDGGGQDAGIVYLLDGDTGTPIRSFTQPRPAAGDFFGTSLAVSGSRILIGMRQDFEVGNGSAFLFDGATGSRLERFDNPGPSALGEMGGFGISVGLDGSRVVVGAAHNDDPVEDAGAVYTYSRNHEPCPPAPLATCGASGSTKGFLKIRASTPSELNDQVLFTWKTGAAVFLPEFGDPTTTDSYALCIYDGDQLVSSTRLDAGGTCAGRSCWKANKTGFRFLDKERTPDGASSLLLKTNAFGTGLIKFKGKGPSVELPPLTSVIGPLKAQVLRGAGGECWSATFTAPFQALDAGSFVDKSD